MLVEECRLLRFRHLESLEPSGYCISFYRWILSASVLKPIKKDIYRREEIVQLDSGTKGSGSKPQGIALAS